jgi:hypothetical protein
LSARPQQEYDADALIDGARDALVADAVIQASVAAVETDTLSSGVRGIGIILTLPSVTEDRHDAVYGETNIRALLDVTVRGDGNDTTVVRQVLTRARRVLLDQPWSADGFANLDAMTAGGGGSRNWTEVVGDRLYRMRQVTLVIRATVVQA